jgi:hypothetical protein
LETIHCWVINRCFLGYEMERRFLCRSDPTLYIRKPIRRCRSEQRELSQSRSAQKRIESSQNGGRSDQNGASHRSELSEFYTVKEGGFGWRFIELL